MILLIQVSQIRLEERVIVGELYYDERTYHESISYHSGFIYIITNIHVAQHGHM